MIGVIDASVLSAGSAPAGRYQLDLTAPADLPRGDASVAAAIRDVQELVLYVTNPIWDFLRTSLTPNRSWE